MNNSFKNSTRLQLSVSVNENDELLIPDSSGRTQFINQKPVEISKVPDGHKIICISANRDIGPVEIWCSSRPSRPIKMNSESKKD